MSAASTPSRSLKRAALLRALRRTPGASRTTLAKELDFSLGTAQLLVDELIDEGVLCAVGVNLSTGGRPSRRISRNRDGPLVLVMGVDLSQMEMRLGLFDLSGALETAGWFPLSGVATRSSCAGSSPRSNISRRRAISGWPEWAWPCPGAWKRPRVGSSTQPTSAGVIGRALDGGARPGSRWPNPEVIPRPAGFLGSFRGPFAAGQRA